jgi:hypothetical protein
MTSYSPTVLVVIAIILLSRITSVNIVTFITPAFLLRIAWGR